MRFHDTCDGFGCSGCEDCMSPKELKRAEWCRNLPKPPKVTPSKDDILDYYRQKASDARHYSALLDTVTEDWQRKILEELLEQARYVGD